MKIMLSIGFAIPSPFELLSASPSPSWLLYSSHCLFLSLEFPFVSGSGRNNSPSKILIKNYNFTLNSKVMNFVVRLQLEQRIFNNCLDLQRACKLKWQRKFNVDKDLFSKLKVNYSNKIFFTFSFSKSFIFFWFLCSVSPFSLSIFSFSFWSFSFSVCRRCFISILNRWIFFSYRDFVWKLLWTLLFLIMNSW